MTLATGMTVLRLLLIPSILLLLLVKEFWWALILFTIASLSDFFDGYLARKFQQTSVLGAILDPISDKLMVLTLLVYFYLIDKLPLWFVLIVAYRDFSIFVGTVLLKLTHKPLMVIPHIIGKMSTACHFLLISLLILSRISPVIFPFIEPVLILCLVVIIASFIVYSKQGIERLSEKSS